jgi:hypothetical protein
MSSMISATTDSDGSAPFRNVTSRTADVDLGVGKTVSGPG